MDLLLVGNDYFKPWLQKAGARVRHLGPGPESEVRADPHRVDLPAIVNGLKPRPDVLVLTDDLGSRVLPIGLERIDIPKVYYGVDSPINLYWQRWLARVFDLVCLDQRDQALALSTELNQEVHWLPVGVDPSLYMDSEIAGQGPRKARDFAFVGTVEPNVRPKRAAILSLLEEHFSVSRAGGRGQSWVGPRESAELYRSSRLVLNENLFPGLTTRMLEVMAAGGCLFTEDVDNGVKDLFKPGVHYIAFGQTDILARARRYLDDPEARQAVADQGRAACLAGHSIQDRTRTLLGLIQGLGGNAKAPDLNALGWSFLLQGLRWPGKGAAPKIVRAGLLFQEHLRRDPGSVSAVVGQTWALTARSKPRQALERLQGLNGTAGQDFRPTLLKAQLLDRIGEKERGRELFRTAARMAGPGNGPDLGVEPGTYEFHLLWGQILDRAGDGLCPGFNRFHLDPVFWGGAEHLRRALEVNPSGIKALEALARILDREGQFAFSHPLWLRAVQLAPDNQAVRAACERAARKSYARV